MLSFHGAQRVKLISINCTSFKIKQLKLSEVENIVIELHHFIQSLALLNQSICLSLKRQYLFSNLYLNALPAQFTEYFTEVNNVYKRSTRQLFKKITLLHS